MVTEKKYSRICECGKLITAYTEGQLNNLYSKHKQGKEHKRRLKEKKEIEKRL